MNTTQTPDGDVNEIVEGEIVETQTDVSAEVAVPDTAADDTDPKLSMILNMEDLIRRHLGVLTKLDQEHNKQKEMLEDIFNSDETYKAHNEKVKEANKVKAQTKLEILKKPEAAALAAKVKDLKAQIKETQGVISEYLQEYQKLSGISEIEDEEGEIREIIYTAKLIKKASK